MAAGAKHSHTTDPRERRTRLVTLLAVWLGGLAAGFFGLLASFARYGCGSGDGSLGCTNSGTAVGVLVIVAVIVIVTVVTVFTYEREPRPVILAGVLGLLGLVACYLTAQGLLSTV